MIRRICERCQALTDHKLILDGTHQECGRCRKVTRRYDLTPRTWAGR